MATPAPALTQGALTPSNATGLNPAQPQQPAPQQQAQPSSQPTPQQQNLQQLQQQGQQSAANLQTSAPTDNNSQVATTAVPGYTPASYDSNGNWSPSGNSFLTRGFLGRAEGAIVNAAGRGTPQFNIDQQTGQLSEAVNKAAPGTLFKNLLVGALSGLAAGAKNPHGGFFGGLGTGFEGGQQQQQQAAQQARANAIQGFNLQKAAQTAQQQAQSANDEHARTALQVAIGNAQMHAATLQNQKLTEEQRDAEAARNQSLVDQDKDNVVYKNVPWSEVQTMWQTQPGISHDYRWLTTGYQAVTDPNTGAPQKDAQGNDVMEPTLTALQPTPNHTLTDDDIKRMVADKLLPSGKTYIPGQTTIPGDQWQAQLNTMDAYEHNQSQKAAQQTAQQQAQANLQRTEAQTGAENATAAHESAETQQLKNGLNGVPARNADGSWNPSSAPVMLVNGDMDPSQLSKRSTKGEYQQALSQANQYSMETTGKPFDIAKASADYKNATNQQTQNTLKMITSLTEPNGSLDIASQAAQQLPRHMWTPVNKLFNSAATITGSPQETNFHTAMLGLADEYSKVMGGGVSSDTGRKQALDILKAGYSNDQMAGAINTLRSDIAARRAGIIGDNRYLQRWYANQQTPADDQKPQQWRQPNTSNPNAQPYNPANTSVPGAQPYNPSAQQPQSPAENQKPQQLYGSNLPPAAQQAQRAMVPNLTNLQTNQQTGQVIGYNGNVWVDAYTGKAVQ